ncbi:MAG: DNA mismatch endonuclease Vsr [Planctomycetota bacterium]
MRGIRGKDTSPEMFVRRLVHSLGYRFRLHRRDLPGTPDLVFPSRRKVIFVHGCFWHRHSCPRGRSTPATRRQFWNRKLDGNRRRDAASRRRLRTLRWRVLVLWECQLAKKNLARTVARVQSFLRSKRGQGISSNGAAESQPSR